MNPLSIPQKLLSAGMAIVILVLAIMLADAKGDVRHERKRADAQTEARIQLAEKYRSAAALAKSNAEGWARGIEQQRAFVTKEVSREYQDQLADLRRRYDAHVLRARQAGADSGLPGGADLPRVPDRAGGAAGAPGAAEPPPGYLLITLDQAYRAEAYRLQLIAAQAWIRGQQAVVQ